MQFREQTIPWDNKYKTLRVDNENLNLSINI